MHEPTVIYEDDDVIAVHKPAGLVVHADGKTQEHTVVDWALTHYPALSGVGEDMMLQSGERIARPGVVHRLDRDTSGVLVLAKHNDAFDALKQQFQNHAVHKVYNAFVYGVPAEQDGVIDKPIGRSKADFRKRSAEAGARGDLREAYTKYRTLQSGAEHTFVEVLPKTGRTHQIRVHFKALQHPVVCDALYAPKRPCTLGFSRLALHARSITFRTYTGVQITAEAPLPDDFSHALSVLGTEDER